MAFKKRQETTRPFDSVQRTTCGNCPTGCGLKVYLKDGSVVDIFGDEEHPINKGSVCPKGLLTLYHLGNPARLTRPQVREDTSRPFRAVGWDEALEFVADGLKRCVAESGKESVAVHASETDPFDYLAAGTLFARSLGTPLTPARFFPGPFGAGGVIARMFGLPASQLHGNTPRDWCNSRCIVLYGCDLAATDPIAFGPVLDARDRGAILLSIDSKNTVTSSKATFSVRVNPGSECVFILGVLRLLIEGRHVDTDFLSDWTEGFDRLKASVQSFTQEAVSRACGIEEAELARFAELAGKARPLQVLAGDWFSRRRMSDADLYGCAALVCLAGSLGIPGGGLNLFGVSPFSFTQGPPQPAGDLSLARLLAGNAPGISALFCHGDSCPAGDDARRALAKASMVVNLSQYPNRALESAHVSIPVSSWLEYDGLLAFNNGRAIQCHRKLIDPPGECRPPLEFWRGLAQAAGLPEAGLLGAGLDSAGFHDALLRQNPLTRGMCYADLDPAANPPGGVLWPCLDRSGLEMESSRYTSGTTRGRNILFQRNQTYPGTSQRFPTSSGTVSFPDALPAMWTCPGDESHPLRLVLGARVDRVEAWGDDVSDTRPGMVEFARMNPRLAAALSIGDGEDVVLAGPRASVRFPVRLSDEVAPGVVRLPAGAGSGVASGSCAACLFEMPQAGNTVAPFARVTAFKAGSDQEAARRAIADLLESCGRQNGSQSKTATNQG